MQKLFKSLTAFLICSLITAFSIAASADTDTLAMAEAIIAGKQDKLVFATIVSIGDNVSSVEVMEEIGEDKKENVKDEDGGHERGVSILGEKIEVEGLESYMYYDGFNHRPKIGDNVLLSLTFSGNVYKVKNGVFYVSAASHDTFNFIVPDTVDGTAGAMELTALYRFVGSNGKNADYTIKDSVVYTHDAANNGVEIRIEEQEGITFVNEKGETTKEAESGIVANRDTYAQSSPYNWIKAVLIIFVGAVIGMFIVKLVVKLEKRSELK